MDFRNRWGKMTNKQIIDDVDVSGCEHLTEIQGCWLSTCDYLKYKGNITNEVCKYNPNCYYKQFKRKENELEELRQYHNKCCEEFKKEKQDLIDKYNQLSINFYNGDYCNTDHCSLLKSKEQECDKLYIQLKADEEYHKEEENTLRKIIKNKEERNIELYKENNKLKQTLTEIKEIAENVQSFVGRINIEDDVFEQMEQILQKISEMNHDL